MNDARAEGDIAAYAKWRRDPNRVTADDVKAAGKDSPATPSLDVDRCEQKDGPMACGRVIGQDGCSVHGRSVWPWPEACCYRNAFEEASHSRTCSRYSEAAASLDVVKLATALDNVDRDYERGWTPAHYARALAVEYDRLARLDEGSATPPRIREVVGQGDGTMIVTLDDGTKRRITEQEYLDWPRDEGSATPTEGDDD